MTITAIDFDRLARFEREVHLRSGAGAGANGTINVCLVQAADWLSGGAGKSDAPECVDPVIRCLGIWLNDSSRFEEWRDELKPFAARIVGTNVGRKMTTRRAYLCADWAVRTIAPMAMDAYGKAPKLAQRMRDVPEIVDKATSLAGRKIAREATKELRAVADAAADAAAADAAYAYAAAAAAAADADAAAARRTLWDESLQLLDRLIRVTEPAAIAS